MTEVMKEWLIGLFAGAAMSFLFCMNGCDEIFYKQGQIDCIQGKVKYERKLQSDGETKWEEKK